MTLWLLLLYAAISGGILLDRNNITLWTEFDEILNKYSEEQEEPDPQPIPMYDKFKNQVESSEDPPGYLSISQKSNVIKRVSHYHYGSGCDCKVESNIIDLGKKHFPRYLMNAVCEDNREASNGKCSHGSKCKPIEYKVSVLTVKNRKKGFDEEELSDQVPIKLRSHFKFNVVTVVAGCICSHL